MKIAFEGLAAFRRPMGLREAGSAQEATASLTLA
jgi:hypothetical protein